MTQKVDFPGKNGKFQTLKCWVWKTTGANTQAPSCPSASARECHVDLAEFHAGLMVGNIPKLLQFQVHQVKRMFGADGSMAGSRNSLDMWLQCPIPWWPLLPTPQDNHILAFLILVGKREEHGIQRGREHASSGELIKYKPRKSSWNNGNYQLTRTLGTARPGKTSLGSER